MTTQMDLSLEIVGRLADLVENRVYYRVFPQNTKQPAWPSILYSFVSVTPNQDICGDGGEETADYRVQLDVVMEGKSGPTAFMTLCKQVKTAMAALKPVWVWDDQFEVFDEPTRTYRLSIDYLVFLSSEDELPPEDTFYFLINDTDALLIDGNGGHLLIA